MSQGRQGRILQDRFRSIFPEARRGAAQLPEKLQSLGPLFLDRTRPLENLHEPRHLRVAREARQGQAPPAGNAVLHLLLELKGDCAAGAHDFGELRFRGPAQGGVVQEPGRFQADLGLQHEPPLRIAHPDRAGFAPHADHGPFQQLVDKHPFRQCGRRQLGNFRHQP